MAFRSLVVAFKKKKYVWHLYCVRFWSGKRYPQETRSETFSHRLLFLMNQPAERRRSLQQLPHTYLCVLIERKLRKEPPGLAQVAPRYLARHIQMEIPTTAPACWKPLSAGSGGGSHCVPARRWVFYNGLAVLPTARGSQTSVTFGQPSPPAGPSLEREGWWGGANHWVLSSRLVL